MAQDTSLRGGDKSRPGGAKISPRGGGGGKNAARGGQKYPRGEQLPPLPPYFPRLWSHGVAKSFNAHCRPDSVEESIGEQQMIDLAISKRGTLIGLTGLVYPV